MTKKIEKISVLSELEEIGCFLLENFIDLPAEAYLGPEAYARFFREAGFSTSQTQAPRVYLSSGMCDIKITRGLSPNHISIGPYTHKHYGFMRTLDKLDLLEGFYFSSK